MSSNLPDRTPGDQTPFTLTLEPHRDSGATYMTTQPDEQLNSGTNIKVVGVGGAGGNAVANMIAKGVSGVEFITANTDSQALARTNARLTIRLGETGLGAGANPSVGRECAVNARRMITEALEGAHMVFITAGMGGGTGTGAAPVIAEIAREMGILTVGVVTKPFDFEGKKRRDAANSGIEELNKHVDSLIIVLNDKLSEVLGDDVTQIEAFAAADDILYHATAGIAEIINKPGMINVDFQDVKTVMSERGRAMMGSGTASGEKRATEAAMRAIACPLLEGSDVRGARGLLVNITASRDSFKMRESKEIMRVVGEHVGDESTIIYGAVYDDTMGEDLRVTVIATGVDERARIVRPTVELVDIKREMAAAAPANPASATDFLRRESRTDSGDFPKAPTPSVWRAGQSKDTLNGQSIVDLAEKGGFDRPAFLRNRAAT
jgi:cell division protein FtsZ